MLKKLIKSSEYLVEAPSSSSELSVSLSELKTVESGEPTAFSSFKVNCCRRSGEQEQHLHVASGKYSTPIFLFIHKTQNKSSHDVQLNKSLLLPHHPQYLFEHWGSCQYKMRSTFRKKLHLPVIHKMASISQELQESCKGC